MYYNIKIYFLDIIISYRYCDLLLLFIFLNLFNYSLEYFLQKIYIKMQQNVDIEFLFPLVRGTWEM